MGFLDDDNHPLTNITWKAVRYADGSITLFVLARDRVDMAFFSRTGYEKNLAQLGEDIQRLRETDGVPHGWEGHGEEQTKAAYAALETAEGWQVIADEDGADQDLAMAIGELLIAEGSVTFDDVGVRAAFDRELDAAEKEALIATLTRRVQEADARRKK